MPIITSAKKRMRQTAKNHARNLRTKRAMKQAAKELQGFIEAKDLKKAQESLKVVYSTIDTAVKKNVLHKNKAARKKSVFNSKVKSLASDKKSAPAKAAPKPASKPKTAAKKTAK